MCGIDQYLRLGLSATVLRKLRTLTDIVKVRLALRFVYAD